ncbi:hypothetical protein FKP32DRAFT_172618 [Trametes sanguinea]|nr:hypothetical protein FKP32DRAFT_172618 [Trametes sanguinea]
MTAFLLWTCLRSKTACPRPGASTERDLTPSCGSTLTYAWGWQYACQWRAEGATTTAAVYESYSTPPAAHYLGLINASPSF